MVDLFRKNWGNLASVAGLLVSIVASLVCQASLDSLGNWGEHEGPPVITLQDDGRNTLVEINSGIDGVRVEDLRTLLVFARRIAFNADEKIDELLGELKKGD
jgi:hypothetical protein